MNAIAVRAPRAFLASKFQSDFFGWVAKGRGNAILKAVAGSGKSTSIVRSLIGIPESASVIILAFNTPIAKEMKDKIVALGIEVGRDFRNVEACTFHSRGFRALTKHLGDGAKIEVDAGKIRKILKDRLSETEVDLYGDFVAKLVGIAKGMGIGIEGMTPDVDAAWAGIIASQDMWLDSEDATETRAIDIARKALAVSNSKAKSERWIDFDDQLYLPLLWNLRFYGHDWVFVDEAQDTNPVRREIARRLLRRNGGRFVAVGDPKQAIYGFTGASHDAMDLIADQFNTVELPLTVSYRCPRAAGELARTIVPYFDVAPGAAEGEVLALSLKQGLERLGAGDMILCRKTAPLIDLAFKLIAEGRGCFVLGREIGASLETLVKKMRAGNLDALLDRLDVHGEREGAKFAKKGEVAKWEALSDRIDAVRTVAGSLREPERTISKLLAKIGELFADGSSAAVITLSTIHKAKGREAPNVGLYMPELCPSKAAKTDEAYAQELNLLYVAYTRTMGGLYLIEGERRS